VNSKTGRLSPPCFLYLLPRLPPAHAGSNEGPEGPRRKIEVRRRDRHRYATRFRIHRPRSMRPRHANGGELGSLRERELRRRQQRAQRVERTARPRADFIARPALAIFVNASALSAAGAHYPPAGGYVRFRRTGTAGPPQLGWRPGSSGRPRRLLHYMTVGASRPLRWPRVPLPVTTRHHAACCALSVSPDAGGTPLYSADRGDA
jgi:hypothetical protein